MRTGVVRRIRFLLGSSDTLELMVAQMKQSFISSSSGEFLPEDFLEHRYFYLPTCPVPILQTMLLYQSELLLNVPAQLSQTLAFL